MSEKPDFYEYVMGAIKLQQKYPHLRIGQAFSNHLYWYWQDMYDHMIDKNMDPHAYDDHQKVGEFLDWVKREWEKA